MNLIIQSPCVELCFLKILLTMSVKPAFDFQFSPFSVHLRQLLPGVIQIDNKLMTVEIMKWHHREYHQLELLVMVICLAAESRFETVGYYSNGHNV